MSMISIEEAREFAQQVCAECDAIYGNPQHMATLALHERARQQRLAERAKQQKETDRRVAKHQALLAARQAARQQIQPQTVEEWRKGVADWDAANPNWHCWFEYRLFKAVQKELDRPDEDLPDLEKGQVATTGVGVLLQLIGKMIGNAHKRLGEDIRELAARIAALQERAASADEERAKLRAALDAKQQQLDSKQKQLDDLQAANALLLNRITKLEAAATANARLSDIEQRLALQQIERDKAKRGAKGDKGEKGERGPQGEQGPPGKLAIPPEIVAWEYSVEDFKARPLMEDGRTGAPLSLQPFLQALIDGILQHMISNEVSNEVDDQLKKALQRLQGWASF